MPEQPDADPWRNRDTDRDTPDVPDGTTDVHDHTHRHTGGLVHRHQHGHGRTDHHFSPQTPFYHGDPKYDVTHPDNDPELTPRAVVAKLDALAAAVERLTRLVESGGGSAPVRGVRGHERPPVGGSEPHGDPAAAAGGAAADGAGQRGDGVPDADALPDSVDTAVRNAVRKLGWSESDAADLAAEILNATALWREQRAAERPRPDA